MSKEERVDQAREAKPARRWKSLERRWSAGLVLGLLVASTLLQIFIPASPTTDAATCIVAALGLLVAGFLSRRLRFIIAAFRYAASALAVLAAIAAAGTMIVQGKPAEFYQERYGAVAGLVLGLHLDDAFHGLIFSAALGAVIGGLLVAMIPRWPIRRRNLGFFVLHAGLVVSMAGAGVSSLFALRGRVDLRVRAPAATGVVLRSADSGAAAEFPLGFSIKLDKFEVDKYGAEFRVGLYQPSPKGGYRLKASFDPEVGARHRLPASASFEVRGYYPDLLVHQRVVDGGRQGEPALQVTLDGKERWIAAGQGASSADGSLAVRFAWEAVPAAPTEGPGHRISVAGGEPFAVQLGKPAKVGDALSLTALRYFPHFTFDLQSHAPSNVDDSPENPALEVEVSKPGDVAKRQWLFAHMPDFRHGGDEAVKLSYAYDPHGPPPAVVVLIGGKDRTVVVKRDGDDEKLSFKSGLDIENGRLRTGRLLAHAITESEPGTASGEPRNPAVLVSVRTDEGTREELLATGGGNLMFGDKQLLVFERREDEVKSFRSTVTLTGGGTDQTTVVAVNQPLQVAGWTFYQANYDPKVPDYSGLDAVHDPGVAWVFFGFGLIVIGIIYVVYLAPSMRAAKVAAP